MAVRDSVLRVAPAQICQGRNKRLQMIVNYNTDISQFWEWSGRGLRPFDETDEAYKLGVNYIMYGLTH